MDITTACPCPAPWWFSIIWRATGTQRRWLLDRPGLSGWRLFL